MGRAFTSSRGTQTQAIVADAASNEDRDAAFSLYFLLGFLSQPCWVLITEFLMDNAGFATALTVLSAMYIVGIFLLGFMRDERPIAMPVQYSRGRSGGGCITGPGHDGALKTKEPSRKEHTMKRLSRRQFLRASGTVVGATIVPSLALSRRVGAAEKALVPKKMPFPPNDEFGSYEPTITPDGNTIYFARFAGSGDKRVLGTTTDIFVTHRIRQSGEWPGTGADWTPPERLPDTVNSDSIDQEPRITPDGKTLYFMSRRSGNPDIWVTHKQPNGEWTKAQSLNLNTPAIEHCFMPLGLPGADDTSVFVSVRPRDAGAAPTADLYTTRMDKGVWQPARRYESKLLDSIGLKCRLNAIARDGLVLGVVSVHDFGKFHTMQFVHYDQASREWKGPIVPAPFNNPAIDGACPMFTAGGDKMIWSAGYDRGPGPVSTSGGTGSTYDLYWLNTSDIVAYYKAKAGPS